MLLHVRKHAGETHRLRILLVGLNDDDHSHVPTSLHFPALALFMSAIGDVGSNNDEDLQKSPQEGRDGLLKKSIEPPSLPW